MDSRAIMQVLLSKLLDWFTVLALLFVTLVVPSIIDNL